MGGSTRAFGTSTTSKAEQPLVQNEVPRRKSLGYRSCCKEGNWSVALHSAGSWSNYCTQGMGAANGQGFPCSMRWQLLMVPKPCKTAAWPCPVPPAPLYLHLTNHGLALIKSVGHGRETPGVYPKAFFLPFLLLHHNICVTDKKLV